MTDYAQRRMMMVDTQVRPNDVTKFPIIAAMLAVPREAFVPASLREAAYIGENVDIGGGRYLLEPRTQAKMLDALDIQPTDLVLDVACALGYSTAVLSRLADAVVAVEADPAMAEEAQAILSREGADNAAVIAGPLAGGAAKHGPYDVVVIEGGVETVPDAILAQLKDGGRIAAIFIDGALGACRIGIKTAGQTSWRFAFNAAAPVLAGFSRQREFQL